MCNSDSDRDAAAARRSREFQDNAAREDSSQPVYAIAWKDTISRCANEETSTKGR
jgi:hypothetical protein